MILVRGITDTGTIACLVPAEQVDDWQRAIDNLSTRRITWQTDPVDSDNLNDALREAEGRG